MIRSAQVDSLPLASGGAPSQTQKEMETTNTTLTMMLAQSNADSVFDPPPPTTITPSRIREAFSSNGPEWSHLLLAISVGLIAYGMVSK